MSFFSLFSSKKKNLGRLDLILDIQSSIVRGSLMLLREGAVPHILWVKNIDIVYRPQGGSSYLIKMAVRAVEDISLAAHAYVKDTHGRDPLPSRIAGVHFVLTSPWIVSRARTISQEFPTETHITRARVADIIKTERSQLASGDSDSLLCIEEKIFDVRLNGYSIPNWEGNTSRNLEVSFAVTLAGTRMIERFDRAARKSGSYEASLFHSSLLLQHTGMSIAIPLQDSYILIHAHGELTDIVVVDGSSCVLFGSHPVGVQGIIRMIAHKLKISASTADSLLSVHESGKLAEENDGPGMKAIAAASLVWVGECKKLLALVPDKYHTPDAVISARFHQTFFIDSFIKEYPSVKVHPLEVDALASLVSFDPRVEALRLTTLYALAIRDMETL